MARGVGSGYAASRSGQEHGFERSNE
jgi:hypothetical protein